MCIFENCHMSTNPVCTMHIHSTVASDVGTLTKVFSIILCLAKNLCEIGHIAKA